MSQKCYFRGYINVRVFLCKNRALLIGVNKALPVLRLVCGFLYQYADWKRGEPSKVLLFSYPFVNICQLFAVQKCYINM